MDYIRNEAIIKGVYRYLLTRVWDDKKDMVTFIMLNPSTANASVDDNTIKKCVRLAINNGFGGIEGVNLLLSEQLILLI